MKWDDNENLFVDLAAEKLLAAQKDKDKIAVEIKTFIGKSTMQDLHLAVGQFIVYRTAIGEKEPDRILFLAVQISATDERRSADGSSASSRVLARDKRLPIKARVGKLTTSLTLRWRTSRPRSDETRFLVAFN